MGCITKIGLKLLLMKTGLRYSYRLYRFIYKKIMTMPFLSIGFIFKILKSLMNVEVRIKIDILINDEKLC